MFDNGELNFYACSVRLIDEPLDDVYDWRADVMNDAWDPKLARRKLKALPDVMVCDALLDQTVFAGVGNIIKNEVLFRIGVHPPPGWATCRQAYRLDGEGSRLQLRFPGVEAPLRAEEALAGAHEKVCLCGGPISKLYLGTTRRRTFFCPNDQVLYGP